MGAPGEPVKNSDAKRGVGVVMSLVVLMRKLVGMCMNVDVAFAIVLMFVGVDPISQRLAEPPQTNGQQHHADQPLTPRRKPFHWQQVPQPKREQADDTDSG